MKKTLLALALLTFTSTVFAINDEHDSKPTTPVSTSHYTTTSGANALAGSASFASGGYSASTSGGNTFNSSPTIQTSYGTPDFPVSSAVAYPSKVTSKCKGAFAAGGQGVNIGLSLSFSTDDDECDIRETADSFMRMGQPQTAIEVMCQSKFSKKTSICQPPKE
jgi:hypothetical protein